MFEKKVQEANFVVLTLFFNFSTKHLNVENEKQETDLIPLNKYFAKCSLKCLHFLAFLWCKFLE